jgi:hypothetical protein
MRNGEPDLQLAGLSLWVYGRQFPDQNDYWDGNWLNVRVRVEATEAVVEAHGSIIHAPELESFANELELLDRKLAGAASLKCTEPNLNIAIRGDSLGHVTVKIMVTPDHMTQSHEFIFSIDQTYFKPLVAECKRILSAYPIRGARDPLR